MANFKKYAPSWEEIAPTPDPGPSQGFVDHDADDAGGGLPVPDGDLDDQGPPCVSPSKLY